MYLPKRFSEARDDVMHAFIGENPLATVIRRAARPAVTHAKLCTVPFLTRPRQDREAPNE